MVGALLLQACAPMGPAAVGGEVADDAFFADGVRVNTMRIGAPQQAQRNVARSLAGGLGGRTLKISNLSSVASRLALGCRKP